MTTDTVKHTPGPWAYRDSKEDCCNFEVYSGEGQSVDIVAGEYGIGSEVDAHLIAAAPDLLDEVTANRNAFAEFAEFILNRPDKATGITRDKCAAMFADMQKRRLACDAVIAKATGGQ